MNIIILGVGRVGFQLARHLVTDGKQVTVIERDPMRAKEIANQLDCMVINDEGNKLEVLKNAGLEDADYFIGVTESDEMNMIACALAAANAKEIYTIARVRNIDYRSSSFDSQSIYGINLIINPEIEVAKVIAQSVEQGAMSNIMIFENSELQMRNLSISTGSPVVDKSVLQIKESIHVPLLMPIILRGDDYLIPTGETVFKPNDIVYLISKTVDFENVFKLFGKPRVTIRRIAIIGCGKLGCYVADYLGYSEETPKGFIGKLARRFFRDKPRRLHMIDRDYEQCRYLTEQYSRAEVTHTDITQEENLEEEMQKGYDCVIATTGSQELNLITGLYAKKVGITSMIAMVHTRAFRRIAQNLGIDVTVSVNDVLVNTILKIIRKGNIKNIYNIPDTPFEIIEFEISPSSPLCNKAIKNLKLPKDTLIIMVTRQDSHLIPHGELTFKASDHVVVITKNDAISRLESIFGVN